MSAQITSIQPTPSSRLATIRRLYFYLVAFISLVAGLIAISDLLVVLIEAWLPTEAILAVNSASLIRNTVARNGGVLLVSTPIFLFHWGYMQAMTQPQSAAGGEERRAFLRKLFLYVGSGFTLFAASSTLFSLLGGSGQLLLNSVGSAAVWPAGWLTRLLHTLIYAGCFIYLSQQPVLDGDLGREVRWAGTVRRLFQTLVGLIGLWMALTGLASCLEIVLRIGLEGIEPALLTVGSDWWATALSQGLAFFLVGTLLWWTNWRSWEQLINTYPVEARTALRRFYLYAATVLSAAVALVPAAGLLNHFLRQMFGVALPAELPDLAGPLSLVPLGVLAWRWHWVQVRSEAERYGDTPESANIRRLYYYLVAAVGLILLWIGLVDILRVLLDWLAVGTDSFSESFRAEQLASGLSLLAVGAPVWALHWRTVQQVAYAEGALAAAERLSGPRRAYLYGVALVGALLILFEFAVVLYRFLLWIMGDPNADFGGTDTLDSLVRSGTAIVFWVIHVLAIRRDTRLTEQSEPLSLPADSVQRAALEAQIQRLEQELDAARARLAQLNDE